MAEMSQAREASSQANAPKETRPIYEVGFHVIPSVDEAEALAVAEKIRTELAKGNAEIINEQTPVKIRLAYTIERAHTGKREHFDEAYFGFTKFAIEREFIGALENMLRADRKVLRFLLVQTVREDTSSAFRRATFTSDRLEGETIKKPAGAPEKSAEVSEEDLDKSIDALVS